MPTIDQYHKDDFIRLLLQGPPGSAKTSTACQFPGAWVLDCDHNLGGPLDWLRRTGKPLPIGYDLIDVDDTGKVVPEGLRFQRLVDCANRAAAQPGVQTLVFDSGTKIGDWIKAHVLRTQPTKSGGFEQASWAFYYTHWVNLISTVTTAKLHSVFIFHEKVDKDELDGSTRVYLNVQGQFKDVAGSFFTDVWRAEVAPVGVPPVHKRVLRTVQDYRYVGLKTRFDLPTTFEFDWKLIEQKLKGGQQ